MTQPNTETAAWLAGRSAARFAEFQAAFPSLSETDFLIAAQARFGSGIEQMNFFEHGRAIPRGLWQGRSDLPPIQAALAVKDAAAQDLLANFFLILEIEPAAAREFWAEYFGAKESWQLGVDLSASKLFATGPLLADQPQLRLASEIDPNAEKENWAEIWDSLTWRFILKNRKKFFGLPGMRAKIEMLRGLGPDRATECVHTAETYFQVLQYS